MSAMVMALSPPIMAGIYTLISLINCVELQVPLLLILLKNKKNKMAAIKINNSIPDYDFVLFWLGNIIILVLIG